jgi:hypothetical protein
MILVIVISVMLLAFIVFLLFRRKENEPVSAEMSEITVAEAQTTEIVKDRSSAVAFAHLAGWLIKKNSSEPKNRIISKSILMPIFTWSRNCFVRSTMQFTFAVRLPALTVK